MEENSPNAQSTGSNSLIYPVVLLAVITITWLYCLPPVLPPYRDAGEMACDVFTLGIAHQPGYPLYIIAAKIFSLFLPGNFAYQLNLFSLICGLGALAIFYFGLAVRFSRGPVLLAISLFALNFTLQTVSGVPEMYSLNFLFAVSLFCLGLRISEAPSRRAIWFMAFLLGFAMTNRMDIVLMAPALAAFIFFAGRQARVCALRAMPGAFLFWLSGFSLYFYLLVRSGSDPLFDWSHPADIATFLGVITRKSYGSTLDLISRNYAIGELFIPNLKCYAVHLAENFNFALLFGVAGAYHEFIVRRSRFWPVFFLFIFSGPAFLFMANMPPNPHALAVVEPYYLLPDIAVVFWIAAGMAALMERYARYCYLVLIACTAFIIYAAVNNLPRACRRAGFAAHDWAADVMRSVEPGASLVGKKDVQIFSLWHLQTVESKRPDLKLVAQGLSGAKWYQNSKGLWRPEMRLFNLNAGGLQEWQNFSRFNTGGFYATLDSEVPKEVPVSPRGLINSLYPGTEGTYDMWPFYNFRWLSGSYSDFFYKDLGTAYAQSIVARAAYLNSRGGIGAEDAARLELARIMDPDMPDPPLYLGFYYSAAKSWSEAGRYFLVAADIYARLIRKADEYRALQDVKVGLLRSSAYAWLNYGVAMEKSGDPAAAEAAYMKALAADPSMAEAHYNMAILYWTKDPRRVFEELKATLALNPSHQQAAYYLSRIRVK